MFTKFIYHAHFPEQPGTSIELFFARYLFLGLSRSVFCAPAYFTLARFFLGSGFGLIPGSSSPTSALASFLWSPPSLPLAVGLFALLSCAFPSDLYFDSTCSSPICSDSLSWRLLMTPPILLGLLSQHRPEIDGLMVHLGFDGRFGLFGVGSPSVLVDRQSLQ